MGLMEVVSKEGRIDISPLNCVLKPYHVHAQQIQRTVRN
jgi:hypothetical protein